MVVGNTRMGGAQAFILNVLHNIDRERFQIDLAINFYAEHDGIEDECRALGCNIYILPYFKVYNYVRYTRVWNTFLSEHRYDIVYAHSTNSASIFLKIAKKHGCKTIAHSHSAGYRGGKIEQLTKKFFVRNVGKVSDYWFACSDKAAKRLYGADYRQYKHYYDIPNAIEAQKYLFCEEIRSRTRKEIGVTDDTFLCGHVGTFSAVKNHIYLVDVFKELLAKKPNAKLVCCGAGALMDSVKDHANELGVLDKIIFAGVVKNCNEYMMAMDVFIFPSIFEGFPVSILEAQATGLPLVMSDVITEEVDLTPLVNRMSIKEKPALWADKMINLQESERTQHNGVIARSKYNMSETVKWFETLYYELANKE